ncbi:putative reverse transcriptase domain-containing protein [Tanacetum coccineum]
MKKDITTYVSKCFDLLEGEGWILRDHQVCFINQRYLSGNRTKTTMDFITKLPKSSGRYDTIWVIVDRLTKSTYFLVIREDYKMRRLARLYIDEIVARHKVHVSIISDRGGRFTSRVWSPVLWAEIREIQSVRPELVQETTNKVILIKEKLKAARDFQKSYVSNMQHVGIIDHEVKSLKRSMIPIVKSIGTRSENSKRGPEFTWERKDHMKSKYPQLFVDCAVELAS